MIYVGSVGTCMYMCTTRSQRESCCCSLHKNEVVNTDGDSSCPTELKQEYAIRIVSVCITSHTNHYFFALAIICLQLQPVVYVYHRSVIYS